MCWRGGEVVAGVRSSYNTCRGYRVGRQEREGVEVTRRRFTRDTFAQVDAPMEVEGLATVNGRAGGGEVVRWRRERGSRFLSSQSSVNNSPHPHVTAHRVPKLDNRIGAHASRAEETEN